MGHRAPTRSHAPRPSAESFHLGIALSAFLAGRIDIQEFERSVDHVLRGGVLNRLGGIGGTRAPQPFGTEVFCR